jgi:hypothetical protein
MIAGSLNRSDETAKATPTVRENRMPSKAIEPEAPIHPAALDPVSAAKQAFAGEIVQRNLVGKLAQIMGDIPEIVPSGLNPHFRYRYIKDTQVLGAVRPRLAREGIIILPDVVNEEIIERTTGKGKTSFLTKLTVLFTIIDSETGERLSGHGIGYGDDEGDKGANKAFTAALKNWLIKLFEIGGEDNDIEADNRTDDRYATEEDGTPVSVTIGDSNVAGVERGGRQRGASEVQVRQVIALAREHGLGAALLAAQIKQVIGDELELEADTATQTILRYLQQLSSEDAGKLITALSEITDDKTAE